MDKDLLIESLLLVDGQEQVLTSRFYEILFERYPDVRPMFSDDVRPQERMLRESIVAVLDNLDDASWLSGNLGALGRKHSGLGVSPPMYGAVAECMIAAMEELGGDAWTPAMTAEWSQALDAVSGLMLAGVPEGEATA